MTDYFCKKSLENVLRKISREINADSKNEEKNGVSRARFRDIESWAQPTL